MWVVHEGLSREGKFYLLDEDTLMTVGSPNPHPWTVTPTWPFGLHEFVDEGTAVTMCDFFNARDYPEHFNQVTPVTN